MREVMSCIELVSENEQLKQDISIKNNKLSELLIIIGDLKKENLEFKKMLETYIRDQKDIVNEVNIIKIKVSNIEKHLGADEDYCIGADSFSEDKEVLNPIHEQLSLIVQRIDDVSLPVLKETVFVGGNTGKMRAIKGFEKLKSMPYKNGKQFITGPQMAKFLAFEIEDDYKTLDRTGKPTINRQAAKNTINLIHEMYPEQTLLNPEKSRTGKKRPFNVISFLDKPEKL
jgi:Icc-related predicted phosphoesterase